MSASFDSLKKLVVWKHSALSPINWMHRSTNVGLLLFPFLLCGEWSSLAKAEASRVQAFVTFRLLVM